jgi:hypothetical protein
MFASMDRLSSELLDELARIYARAAARAYFSQIVAEEARSRACGVSPRHARVDQHVEKPRNQESPAG